MVQVIYTKYVLKQSAISFENFLQYQTMTKTHRISTTKLNPLEFSSALTVLVAQLVGASISDMCRAVLHRVEPRSILSAFYQS